MKILIIEDNELLAQEIANGLKKYGFICDVATLGEQGEELAYVSEYDAIILDLNLPDKDGIEILKFLRQESVNTPILIATARDKLNDRTLGLDVGADDYIIKPFEIDEIRARIQAIVRRSQGRSQAEMKVGRLVFHPVLREVTIDHKKVTLQAKELDILEYIISRHPKSVFLEEITDYVYGENYTNNSSVIRVHIAKLQMKLKDAAGIEVIQNKRGKGYYLWEE